MRRASRSFAIHPGGVLYIFVTLLLGVGAVNSQNSLLFLIFGAALGGVLVSGVVSGLSLLGVEVERHLPARLRAGRTTPVLYALRNRRRWLPAFGLRVREEGISRADGLETGTAFAAYVPPRSVAHLQAPLAARRRGRITLRRLRVETTFPFGVARKAVRFEETAEAIVHPAPAPPPPGWLQRLRQGETGGEGGRLRPGAGEEFFALREAREGDSPRSVAWRSSAKADRLLVRENAAPAPRSLWIVLDLARATDEQCERAIAQAAAMVEEALTQELAVGVACPQTGLRLGPLAAGRSGEAARTRLLDALALLQLPPAKRRIAAPATGLAGAVCTLRAASENSGLHQEEAA